jgi:hypothetical protein
MDEHGTSSFSNSTNMPFSNTILVVGIYTTKCDALILLDVVRMEVF